MARKIAPAPASRAVHTKSPPAPKASATFVALLRGINVGGKNKLPMQDLAALCTEIGCSDVRTYIQSGNVVFAAPASLAARFATDLQQAIAAEFSLRVPVVLRSAAQLGHIAAGNPFVKRGIDPTLLHVAFLADPPGRAAAASLDPQRSPGDAFTVAGQEVFLHLPNGVARSKLTNAWFDGALGTTSTIRNWRTVLTLLELTLPQR